MTDTLGTAMSDADRPPLVRIGCKLLVGVLFFETLFAAAIIWATVFLCHYGSEPGNPADVRRVIEGQAADWNRGDLDGFMRGYLKSDDLTFVSGGTVTK